MTLQRAIFGSFTLLILSTSIARAQEPQVVPLPTPLEIEGDPEAIEDAPLDTSDRQAAPFEAGGADEAERTLFDIYLGDKFKGAVLADYTEAWLEISDPGAVIEQLKDLKNGQELLPLIKGRIDGLKEIPEVGSVGFDLNTFRIIINPAEKFLSSQSLELKRLSPDPNAGFSLQQRIGATASGALESEEDIRSAFNHRSIASYGQFFSVADGAVISNQSYELNEATAGGIFGEYRAGGGLLQTSGNPFSPTLQYTGMNIETAHELFLDQDLIRGSRFEVFVPSRSKVEFYRDGRLLAVQVLDFGLREIDTSQFPQGSYDIDIVITDSFGVVTRERKFFTKAGFLTSRNQPIFSLQAGNVRDDLEFKDTSVYQAGVRWRATDIFDLGGSLYGSDALNVAFSELRGLYRNFRFSMGGAYSDEDDAGVTGSFGGTLLETSFDISTARTINGGLKEEPLPTPDPDDPFGTIFDLRTRREDVTFQDRESLYGSVFRKVGPLDIRYAAERNSGEGSPDRERHGPTVEWRIHDSEKSNSRLQVTRLFTDEGRFSSIGLLYGHRFARSWILNSHLAFRTRPDINEGLIVIAANYDGKGGYEQGTRLGLRSEVLRKDDDRQGKSNSLVDQIDIDHTSSYLRTIGFIRDTRTSDEDNTSLGLSASTSFLVAPGGGISLAHPVSNEAVFVAEVPPTTTSSEFEVLIDDQVRTRVNAGESAVVGVAPYKRYTVRIRPIEGADLVEYDSSSSTHTFFPGNVFRRVFTVQKVFILLGRVIDPQGNPLAHRRIKGPKEYTATEDDGSFQAEISGDERLTIEDGEITCQIELTLTEKPQYFINAGDLVCEPFVDSGQETT